MGYYDLRIEQGQTPGVNGTNSIGATPETQVDKNLTSDGSVYGDGAMSSSEPKPITTTSSSGSGGGIGRMIQAAFAMPGEIAITQDIKGEENQLVAGSQAGAEEVQEDSENLTETIVKSETQAANEVKKSIKEGEKIEDATDTINDITSDQDEALTILDEAGVQVEPEGEGSEGEGGNAKTRAGGEGVDEIPQVGNTFTVDNPNEEDSGNTQDNSNAEDSTTSALSLKTGAEIAIETGEVADPETGEHNTPPVQGQAQAPMRSASAPAESSDTAPETTPPANEPNTTPAESTEGENGDNGETSPVSSAEVDEAIAVLEDTSSQVTAQNTVIKNSANNINKSSDKVGGFKARVNALYEDAASRINTETQTNEANLGEMEENNAYLTGLQLTSSGVTAAGGILMAIPSQKPLGGYMVAAGGAGNVAASTVGALNDGNMDATEAIDIANGVAGAANSFSSVKSEQKLTTSQQEINSKLDQVLNKQNK